MANKFLLFFHVGYRRKYFEKLLQLSNFRKLFKQWSKFNFQYVILIWSNIFLITRIFLVDYKYHKSRLRCQSSKVKAIIFSTFRSLKIHETSKFINKIFMKHFAKKVLGKQERSDEHFNMDVVQMCRMRLAVIGFAQLMYSPWV